MAKEKKNYQITVDERLCDGCLICVSFCRKQVYRQSETINSKGVYPSLPVNSKECRHCRFCEFLCPQLAVYIEEE